MKTAPKRRSGWKKIHADIGEKFHEKPLKDMAEFLLDNHADNRRLTIGGGYDYQSVDVEEHWEEPDDELSARIATWKGKEEERLRRRIASAEENLQSLIKD